MSPQRLFDDLERDDSTPAWHSEGSFAFMNRVATPWWHAVRELQEAWYLDYCASAEEAKQADLRRRFQSRNQLQHNGAWWELYVHALTRRVYPSQQIEVEPAREGYTTRPDYCVSDDSGVILWVEAVSTTSGLMSVDPASAAEAYVLDTINEVQSADFRVAVRIVRSARTHPRKRAIVDQLASWLEGLHRIKVLREIEAGGPRPQKTITAGEWCLQFEAWPKGEPGLHAHDRLIGIGPAKGGFVDDARRARAAVKRKGGHYDGLAAPLLVALLPLGGPFGVDDGITAFYGSEAVRFDPADPEGTSELIRRPDGLWSAGDGEVSAVLVGNNLRPWTVAECWPELWLNPAPTYALQSGFGGVPRFEAGPDGRLEHRPPAEKTPARLFDLPRGWPGAEPWAT